MIRSYKLGSRDVVWTELSACLFTAPLHHQHSAVQNFTQLDVGVQDGFLAAMLARVISSYWHTV
jgi:hypothetical protein